MTKKANVQVDFTRL